VAGWCEYAGEIKKNYAINIDIDFNTEGETNIINYSFI